MASMGWLVLESKSGKRTRGKQVEIPATGTLLCGRSNQADLILAETAVSRRHAIFFHEGGSDWVRDAGSTNGTLLNGEPLVDPCRLRDGDQVQVGVVKLAYREFVSRPPGRPVYRGSVPSKSDSAADLLLSDTPRWRGVTLVGRGGMGEVYRAHDKDLGEDVAIKRLRQRPGRDQRLLERLHAREAALGRTIEHPNVVRVLEEGVIDDDPLLLMEWIEGKDLSVRSAELSLLEKLEVLRQTALGLDAAHRAGIVHADLKPANLLLSQDRGATDRREENLEILERPSLESESSPDDALEREIAERIGLPDRPDLENLPFVGREGELAYFEEIIKEIRHGGKRWVLLYGERGVGRHRLVQEVQRLAAEQGDLIKVESPAEWGPPPADFEGVWVTPLPPFFPEDQDLEREAQRARSLGEVRELFLKPLLRGQALRLVERICRDRVSARQFVDAIDREISSHPALLAEALESSFDRGAWCASGGGYRVDPTELRPDERAVAETMSERLRAEEKGIRDLLISLSPIAGALDFDAIREIVDFDSASLYYLLGHSEQSGYLVRCGDRELGFANDLFRRSLDRSLSDSARRKIVRRALPVLEKKLSSGDSSSRLFLCAAELARSDGRLPDSFRWSLSAALLARQSYDRTTFFSAIDGARECYRDSMQMNKQRIMKAAGEEILGPGGGGLNGLDRLRQLPMPVVVKIADFGIARRIDREEGTAAIEELPWGTPRYMSPEQAKGLPMGTSSDIYSLGLVARELLEGRHPLGSRKGREAIRAIIKGLGAPQLDDLNEHDERLNRLFEEMLADDASRRPTAQEVADRIQRLQIQVALDR